MSLWLSKHGVSVEATKWLPSLWKGSRFFFHIPSSAADSIRSLQVWFIIRVIFFALFVLDVGVAPTNVIPFRTAVPFWGQTAWSLTGLSPKRDYGSKRVNSCHSKVFWARPVIISTYFITTAVRGHFLLPSPWCAPYVVCTIHSKKGPLTCSSLWDIVWRYTAV